MMGILLPSGTTFLYKVMWALLPPNVVLYVWLTVDYLAHPLATGMYGPAEFASPYARALITLVFAPMIVIIGVLIMRRAPGNVIGVLVTIMGLYIPAFEVGAHSGPLLPTLQAFMIPIWYSCLIFLVILFPDGRAHRPRVEGLLTVIMIYQIALSAVNGFADLQLSTYGPMIYNALYVPELEPLNRLVALGEFIVVIPVLVVGVFLSPLLRYRATRPGSRERQQIKWLAFCAAIMALFLAIYAFVNLSGVSAESPAVRVFRLLYGSFYTAFPPITLGLAILRHNLYDVDIIIRRTLVYSILTALLALTYWGGVVGLQAVLRPITGEGNDLSIVATTLAVAALFLPLRRLVQGFIDRRFYRRKYDAARTLQAFSQHVRDEVNLNSLTGHLVQVVDDTMRPEHLSLWLRPADGPRSSAPTAQEVK